MDPKFVDVGRSTRFDGVLNIFFLKMTAQDDHGEMGDMFPDLLKGFQAGHDRHRNVRDNEVPLISEHSRHQFLAVLYIFYQPGRIFRGKALLNQQFHGGLIIRD